MADEQNLTADELETLPTIDGGDDQPDPADEPQTLPDHETDETGDDPEQPDADSEDDELDVIELDGKQYQVPKAIKAGFMMNADYTRKTQEVSEQRKALDTRQAEIEQQAEATEDELKARAQLMGIEERLGQYEKVDWDRLEREDPMGAQTHWRIYQQLQNQHQQTQQTLSERQEERTRSAQQDLAKRIEETRTFAQTQIKGWSPDVDRKVQEYIVEKGIPQEFVAKNLSPVFYDILHKAMIGEQSLKKHQAAKPQPQPISPTRKVTGRQAPSSRKTYSEMSVDEYVEARNRAERAKARR